MKPDKRLQSLKEEKPTRKSHINPTSLLENFCTEASEMELAERDGPADLRKLKWLESAGQAPEKRGLH